MAAGDLVQKGTSVVVGFNSRTVGTWIMDESTQSPQVDITPIRGAQGAVVTKILTNPRMQYRLTGILLTADLTAMGSAKIGDMIAVNSTNCMIDSLDITFGREAAKATLVVVKEDSMTYT